MILLMLLKSGFSSPVEVQVVYLPLFTRVFFKNIQVWWLGDFRTINSIFPNLNFLRVHLRIFGDVFSDESLEAVSEGKKRLVNDSLFWDDHEANNSTNKTTYRYIFVEQTQSSRQIFNQQQKIITIHYIRYSFLK